MRDDLPDAELDRLLSASSPYRPAPDARLDARAEAALSSILAGRPARRRRRLALVLSVPTLAAAVVALLVVLVVNPFVEATPAAADRLRPLAFTESPLTVSEQFSLAQQQLAAGSGPPDPVRSATTVAWYAHIQMDGPDAGGVVSPEVETRTWSADLTAHIRVTAGRSYSVTGQLPVREDLEAEGTLLRDDSFPASDFLFEGAPPPWMVAGAGAEFYRSYFADAYELSGRDPAAVLRAVGDLQDWWTLTDAQEADILAVLRSYPEISLRGTAQDRAGREVFALSAVSNPGLHEEVLLISLDTGRIFGAETTYIGDDPEVPLRPDTVISYRLWDVAGH